MTKNEWKLLIEKSSKEFISEMVKNVKSKGILITCKPNLKETDYSLRGMTAGQAIGWFYRPVFQSRLRFNLEIAELNGWELFEKTVAHECAHIVVGMIRFSNKDSKYFTNQSPHGYIWKSVFSSVGFTPDVCHHMKAKPARKTRQFLYMAGNVKRHVGIKRHNKMQAGAVYIASCNNKKLEFVKEVTKEYWEAKMKELS